MSTPTVCHICGDAIMLKPPVPTRWVHARTGAVACRDLPHGREGRAVPKRDPWERMVVLPERHL